MAAEINCAFETERILAEARGGSRPSGRCRSPRLSPAPSLRLTTDGLSSLIRVNSCPAQLMTKIGECFMDAKMLPEPIPSGSIKFLLKSYGATMTLEPAFRCHCQQRWDLYQRP